MEGAKGCCPRARGGRSQWGYETPTCTAGSWADAILPGAELGQWAQNVLVSPQLTVSILTHPPENLGSSQGRAPPHQQNTLHPHGSCISTHPCPPCHYPVPHSSADQGYPQRHRAKSSPGPAWLQSWRRERKGAKAEPGGGNVPGICSTWEPARAFWNHHGSTSSHKKGRVWKQEVE